MVAHKRIMEKNGISVNEWKRENELIEQIKYIFFMKQKSKINWNELCKNLDKQNLLVVVAFNNATVIEWQSKLVHKFYPEAMYIVADNSTDINASERIEQICINGGGIYVRIPNNPFKLSKSHGAALNWVCRNVIARGKVQNVGFLDHDCFPTRRVKLWDILNHQDFYGVIQEREKGWYLWPGFAFFNLERINVNKLNFLPNEWGDTGAGNYRNIFSSYSKNKLKFVEQTYHDLGIVQSTPYIQEFMAEYYDDQWLHMMNASNWLDIRTESKEEKIYSFLNTLYNQ